jgi:hypothetical protein
MENMANEFSCVSAADIADTLQAILDEEEEATPAQQGEEDMEFIAYFGLEDIRDEQEDTSLLSLASLEDANNEIIEDFGVPKPNVEFGAADACMTRNRKRKATQQRNPQLALPDNDDDNDFGVPKPNVEFDSADAWMTRNRKRKAKQQRNEYAEAEAAAVAETKAAAVAEAEAAAVAQAAAAEVAVAEVDMTTFEADLTAGVLSNVMNHLSQERLVDLLQRVSVTMELRTGVLPNMFTVAITSRSPLPPKAVQRMLHPDIVMTIEVRGNTPIAEPFASFVCVKTLLRNPFAFKHIKLDPGQDVKLVFCISQFHTPKNSKEGHAYCAERLCSEDNILFYDRYGQIEVWQPHKDSSLFVEHQMPEMRL